MWLAAPWVAAPLQQGAAANQQNPDGGEKKGAQGNGAPRLRWFLPQRVVQVVTRRHAGFLSLSRVPICAREAARARIRQKLNVARESSGDHHATEAVL
jgi:hypothetical protein